MRKILKLHTIYWSNKKFRISAFFGIAFFAISLIIHNRAGMLATENMSNPVTDLLLQIIPKINTSIIFVEGAIVFWVLVTILLLNKPEKIPYILKTLALFLLVRSFFISLTHLGLPEDTMNVRSNLIVDAFTFKGDFFFSGHTGAPFLMALCFWQSKYLRLMFLFSSVFFATSVLLGRVHYSIDVFAAFFISFGIYHLSLKFFPSDHSMFLHGLIDKK